MNTSDLINILVMDRAPSLSLRYTIAVALAIGALFTGLAFLPMAGIRPDIAQVALSWRFLAKVAIVLMIAGSAIGLTLRLGRPDGELGHLKWAPWLVLLVLALAVGTELIVVPPAQWENRLFGIHWLFCMGLILLFSLPPLVGLLVALKYAAPRNESLAGAIAGIAAGGIGATIYVAHCPDDSPLFVAAWYTLAIGFVALSGLVVGRRLLRW